MRPAAVAAISLVFTGLFFVEYLPPIQRVHIPYDLADYHYPLDDYAFQAIRQHRLPEWDATIYCGMSFVGNPQTAMFYPPMWLVFAANLRQPWLRYSTLEIFVFVHVWLGFLFCYLWLRCQKYADLACILGGGVFAYSGYMLLQLQHLGLACAYAWFPFGLWGIDRAIHENRWKPLWRLAIASAMCFLAGYPPIWFVFAVIVITYSALRRKPVKILARVSVALAFSLLLAMVQLLPSWQLTAGRSMGPKYSSGSLQRLDLWTPYLLPNYFDFSLTTSIYKNPGGEYLYLGVPALFGLFFLLTSRKRFLSELPMVGVCAICIVLVTNPFNAVWTVLKHSEMLSQICRSWYFLAGITLAAASLAAAGIDAFLNRTAKPLPRWLAPLAIACAAAWSAWEVYVWLPGGPEFPPGWSGAMNLCITLLLFCVLMLLVRAHVGVRRAVLIAVLLASAGVDYKAFGTSKRVNAMLGNLDSLRRQAPYRGMNDETFRLLERNRDYRVALDNAGPTPESLRHQGLSSPQGRDPLVSGQIRGILGNLDYSGFGLIDPSNHNLLRLLGVRYFVTSESQPDYQKLLNDPSFRLLPSKDYYYQVFDFQAALPMYRWEQERPGDQARKIRWLPGERRLDVTSATGGRFVLVEQMFPGWTASIDGEQVPVERWNNAFQSIQVPPGEHQVVFRFRSRALRLGALISVLSLLALGISYFASNSRSRLNTFLNGGS